MVSHTRSFYTVSFLYQKLIQSNIKLQDNQNGIVETNAQNEFKSFVLFFYYLLGLRDLLVELNQSDLNLTVDLFHPEDWPRPSVQSIMDETYSLYSGNVVGFFHSSNFKM